MKRMILLTSAVVSLTFAQTGMMTADGESGMGVWLNHGIYQIDNDEYDGKGIVGFEYMTSVGVEVGLNILEDAKGLDIGYHHKMDNWNMNISWTRIMNDDNDDNMDHLWFLGYSNQSLYGGIGGHNPNNTEWEFENFIVGKIWTFDMGISVGFSYDSTFDTIDEGELKINLGYNF